jgi:hypothetical protein
MNRQSKPETDWTDHKDLIVRIVSPEVAADKLDRSIDAVMARRRELGLPDPTPDFTSAAKQRKKKPSAGEG